MEDRCVVCGTPVPEGLQVCVPCMLANDVERIFVPHLIVLRESPDEASSRRRSRKKKSPRRSLFSRVDKT